MSYELKAMSYEPEAMSYEAPDVILDPFTIAPGKSADPN